MSIFESMFKSAEELVDSRYEKLNPSQPTIAENEGDEKNTTKHPVNFNRAYNCIETVGRGIDLIIDSATGIDFDVKEKLPFEGMGIGAKGLRAKKLSTLLNHQPNLFQDISSFRRSIFMDILVEGNAFIFYDGAHLFHLPADNVKIITDKKTFIRSYIVEGSIKTTYGPDEIIHIKDNSIDSVYRGDSRLKSAQNSINILTSMLAYQENFFDNGAVPGLVLTTDDILSDRIKDRMVTRWIRKYNPRTGGRKPVVLDGGLKIDTINSGSFQELEFTKSIEGSEERILKALGVPPILLNAGNNANISPNVKLFYLSTVIPLVDKIISSMEAFFAYDIDSNIAGVVALRPELKDEAGYYTGLVNNGIMLGSEARAALRLEDIKDEPLLTTIRIPANVAGSATGVDGQTGGKPTTSEE